jgi:hypothetical protein
MSAYPAASLSVRRDTRSSKPRKCSASLVVTECPPVVSPAGRPALTRCPPYVLHRSGWRLPLLVQTGHGEQIPHYKGHGDVSDLEAPHESQHAPRGAWRRGPRPARLDAPRVPPRTTRGATTWLSWTLPRTACRFPCLVPGHSVDQKRTKSAGLVRTRVDATRGQFSEGNRGGRRFSELAGLPPTRLRIPPPPV